jgi:peptide/nickel transport system substrate-binding protein
LIHGRTEGVEATDPSTVRFRFKEPFPDFLEYFTPGISSIGWVVPKKYVEKVGDAGFKRNPIGCGPYKFVEFVPGVKLVAEAFEGYWRKAPQIQRMEFLTVTETATRLVMAKRGEVDIATLMQGVFYDDAKKDPKLRLFSPFSPVQRIIYITSQWDNKSPWSDPRVRKAASLAIDRKTLADVHMPGTGPIGGLGLDADPLTVQFPPDPYDPEQAKRILAEAGYPKGFHGGKFYPSNGVYWAYGEQIATYWKAVGITVETVLLDRPAWWANREGGKMKGALFVDPVSVPTIGGGLSYLLGQGSYGNYPDIQALWERYRKEVVPQTRKDLIAQIQKAIHERTLWISVSSSNSPAAVGPRVKGNPWRAQPIIWFTAPFEDVEIMDK